MESIYRKLNSLKLEAGVMPVRINFLSPKGDVFCFKATIKTFKKCIKNGFFRGWEFVSFV